MADIYSLCPQGYPRNPFPLGLYQYLLYQLDDITWLSTSQCKPFPEDGPPALFLGRHPSMTVRTMDLSRNCMQISQGNIVGRVELTALRSGRADTSVNPRSIRFYFKRAIWKNNAAHHHRYHQAVGLQRYQNGRAGGICCARCLRYGLQEHGRQAVLMYS